MKTSPEETRAQRLAATLAPVLSIYPEIAAVYLFGSFARAEERPDSDLDLGIVFRRRGDTALDHHRMLGDLASRVEQKIPGRRIDIVVLESQGVLFAHRVLLEGRLLFEGDRERRIDFEETTLSRAFDFRPIYERATRGRQAGLLERIRRVP